MDDPEISQSLAAIEEAVQGLNWRRARALLVNEVEPKVLSPQNLRRAVSLSGILLDHAEYRRMLLSLLKTHRAKRGDESYAAVFCQIYYGLENWVHFAETSKDLSFPVESATDRALGWAKSRHNDLAYPDYDREKIFCIGLSKTATSSVGKSLEMLGYASVHWRNPITSKVLTHTDIHSFDAFSDISISYNFEYLYYAYKNSKFIYTVRDIGDWLTSFERHYEKFFGASTIENIRRRHRHSKRYGSQVWLDSHYALYLSARDPIEAYVRHENRVLDFFRDKPRSRFLNLDVFAGNAWPEICEFMGSEKAKKKQDFPWLNKTA